MTRFFLATTILGAVVLYLFFLDFFAGQGIQLQGFVAALLVNGAAGGFTADLLITSLVYCLCICM
ncbi:MAG: DUF2834 domain-containing protein [Pseudomonadales bacterium]|nr:DUF2834 domain-containing protein [Pseudomonadales bacterium]MDP6471001.1 DUF2834 domain-containing protein [Pseudomonadales bacterium]MDP6825814.1 DUF2834 domain-containing protein [Pseudomonadales bacterium]MDP6970193.1 DUF2834 domain-containing protein [Pseudomonadales bacterium]